MMATNMIDLNAWRQNLQMGDKGPRRNLTNTVAHLRGMPQFGKKLRYNEMTQQPEWDGRPIEDPDVVDIRLLIERENYQPVDKDIVPAILRVCMDNKYHPIRDFLDGVAWDGTPRIDQWMQKHLGAPDTAFTRLVGPKSLIAAVARAYVPGCKVDTIVVLEGAQGLKKSSAIAALFGEEYTFESVGLFDQHNKMVMQMMGAWCVELAEFVAFVRKDQNSVKGMISMRSDRVVLSYGKRATTHPRQCVFFATINPDGMGFLTDDTGNRRYWPVTVTDVDLDGIERNRAQMWAEAAHRYRQGERWWLEGDENRLAEAETADRQEQEVWTPILQDKLMGFREVTVDRALTELGIPHERKDRRAQMRVAKALKELGFVSKTPKDSNGKTYRIWVR